MQRIFHRTPQQGCSPHAAVFGLAACSVPCMWGKNEQYTAKPTSRAALVSFELTPLRQRLHPRALVSYTPHPESTTHLQNTVALNHQTTDDLGVTRTPPPRRRNLGARPKAFATPRLISHPPSRPPSGMPAASHHRTALNLLVPSLGADAQMVPRASV